MSDKLMTAEEIARVSGKKRYSKQIEWFKEQFGFTAIRCGDGSPVVTWATFEALQQKAAGLSPKTSSTERPPLRSSALRSVK